MIFGNYEVDQKLSILIQYTVNSNETSLYYLHHSVLLHVVCESSLD